MSAISGTSKALPALLWPFRPLSGHFCPSQVTLGPTDGRFGDCLAPVWSFQPFPGNLSPICCPYLPPPGQLGPCLATATLFGGRGGSSYGDRDPGRENHKAKKPKTSSSKQGDDTADTGPVKPAKPVRIESASSSDLDSSEEEEGGNLQGPRRKNSHSAHTGQITSFS